MLGNRATSLAVVLTIASSLCSAGNRERCQIEQSTRAETTCVLIRMNATLYCEGSVDRPSPSCYTIDGKRAGCEARFGSAGAPDELYCEIPMPSPMMARRPYVDSLRTYGSLKVRRSGNHIVMVGITQAQHATPAGRTPTDSVDNSVQDPTIAGGPPNDFSRLLQGLEKTPGPKNATVMALIAKAAAATALNDERRRRASQVLAGCLPSRLAPESVQVAGYLACANMFATMMGASPELRESSVVDNLRKPHVPTAAPRVIPPQVVVPVTSGAINTSTGEFYPEVVGGYVTGTGKFIPR